jgi:large subunit ribosomal protein L46
VDRAVGVTNRWFISNAPVGHYCYSYPPDVQTKRENFGAKVYYYRTQLLAGNVKLQTKLYTDYAWIARDEVGEYFDPETADFFSYLLPH